ncbi:hypothetical protein JMA_43110 (plasmid) [Jeotgalibacillus malaysiensis]|uniref:Uncharacterized protein n=1 Tax=Jeotgalibacillus malaysiensis TaxID=1508404 RepID=A0A0B5AYN6_9BACL|nr:DUF5698 domain-containing protein [Jeotgalibacillus malaysiensis]AJD93628.1 hypothetical protein JMA_43110 [Jeotgalibacillus malaysiensis]
MKEILIILALQLVYVPIVTMRTMMLVKGKTRLASILGTVDVFIYVTALGVILKDPSLPGIITYAIGFGIGIAIGSYIERKLAIGEQLVQIHVSDYPEALKTVLGEADFGLTIYQGEGLHGERYRIDVLAPRHRVKELKMCVRKIEPKAFMIVLEPADFDGGFVKEDEHRLIK